MVGPMVWCGILERPVQVFCRGDATNHPFPKSIRNLLWRGALDVVPRPAECVFAEMACAACRRDTAAIRPCCPDAGQMHGGSVSLVAPPFPPLPFYLQPSPPHHDSILRNIKAIVAHCTRCVRYIGGTPAKHGRCRVRRRRKDICEVAGAPQANP
ncbi:hypothetical protein N9L68_07775 [bacterium]|nr:hypothetical protein [bacterium]